MMACAHRSLLPIHVEDIRDWGPTERDIYFVRVRKTTRPSQTILPRTKDARSTVSGGVVDHFSSAHHTTPDTTNGRAFASVRRHSTFRLAVSFLSFVRDRLSECVIATLVEIFENGVAFRSINFNRGLDEHESDLAE